MNSQQLELDQAQKKLIDDYKRIKAEENFFIPDEAEKVANFFISGDEKIDEEFCIPFYAEAIANMIYNDIVFTEQRIEMLCS